GTGPSTLRAPAQAPKSAAPRAVFGPAIADCGFREPLAPRLARPGETMLPALSYRPFSGSGRVAQRESARFTRGRSLVRSQVRPSLNRAVSGSLSLVRPFWLVCLVRGSVGAELDRLPARVLEL